LRFFDLHADTPYLCFEQNIAFNDFRLAVTPDKADFLTEWRQCFAVFVRDDAENPYSYYNEVLRDFKRQISGIKKPKIYYTLEGASLIDSTEKVFKIKKDGIRAVTLTWNGENKIAGGVNSQKGLSPFGAEVIEALNKNKICCDLSHLNKKSFFDVTDRAEYPFASHSNCSFICKNPRNLTDEQIKLIAERKGIIGLCFYPQFLSGEVFSSLYKNIYHLLSKGLEDNISVGSDFDGALMDKSLDGIDKIPALYGYLEQKGLSKNLLDKIFYTNALKFFDKTEDMI